MQSTNMVTRWLERYKQVNYWLLILPMISLIGMFLLDALNVTTIRLFGVRATPVQKELVEELIILVVFIALAYVLLGPGHIKTNVLKNRFGPRLRFAADVISDTAVLFLASFCTWTTGLGTVHMLRVNEKTMGYVEIPLVPFFIVITVSFALLTIAALLVMVQHIQNFKEGRRDQLSVS